MRSRILIAAVTGALLSAGIGAAAAPAEDAAGRPSGERSGHRLRDVVLTAPPTAAASRKAARADGSRYPVDDGRGRTVRIDVTTACAADAVNCSAADPAEIASFLGSLEHGNEMNSLSVLVAHPFEMDTHCGDALALACYYSDSNQMVIPGRDFTAGDGANRKFVIAHEYGHHIADHRRNPPFVPPVFYGTKRWNTYERVCPGIAAGRYFPGNQGTRYYQNPGEAFAEAYAFSHFPAGMVDWNWDESLKPDSGAYAAIRADVRRPWAGRKRLVRRGRVGMRRKRGTQRIAAPLDGDITLLLRAERGAQLDLFVHNARGRLLAASTGFGSAERIRLEVCGQRRLRVTIRRQTGQRGGTFRLIVWRP